MNDQPALMFFCALPSEAKPLIDHYSLKKISTVSPFGIYSNDEIYLTVTGVGKINMAAALSYTLALYPTETPVLINLGIAGHPHQARGKLFLADKVTDRQQPGLCFYPQWLGATDYDFLPLITVIEPTEDYDQQALFDMEASAFYQTAIKFSTVELIHCLKIISDNAEFSTDQVNARRVNNWVAQNIDAISTMVTELLSTRSALLPPEHPQLNEILQRYHFSATSRQQLAQSLMHWKLLSNDQTIPLDQQHFKNGKQLLRWLKQQDLPFNL